MSLLLDLIDFAIACGGVLLVVCSCPPAAAVALFLPHTMFRCAALLCLILQQPQSLFVHPFGLQASVP